MSTLMKNVPGTMANLPSFFDDFFTRDLFDWGLGNRSDGGTLPAVNIKETNDSYELDVAAPGMTRDDFNVELNEDTLVISGNINEESENENEGYTRREFRYESFQRSFRLPEKSVISEKITAKYDNGILHISIPKAEEAKVKPPKKIRIN